MRTFKFLSQIKQSTYQWGGGNLRTIVYDLNGTHITILNELSPANTNRIECENYVIKLFRWVRNFDHRLILGENSRTNSQVYEGTIGRFFETYDDRKRMYINRHAKLPNIPVIEKIEYGGSTFLADTLKFSNNNMWVKITYKKFYARV